MANKKPPVRVKAFNTRISEEHLEKARKLAGRNQMSQADLVEQMIDVAWNDRYGRKAPRSLGAGMAFIDDAADRINAVVRDELSRVALLSKADD